jgi:2-haloacid dehalogenase
MDAYLRLTAFPDVKVGLEALREQGLQLAILSNGAPRMLQAAVASAGLGPWIDEIISVSDIRIFKPSPRVYQLIGQKLKLPGHQIGFVSSNSWDINGAGAAGLYTFWIQRSPSEPQEELGFPACQVVTTIPELAQLIR